jgi:succinylglutamate desuccinylase
VVNFAINLTQPLRTEKVMNVEYETLQNLEYFRQHSNCSIPYCMQVSAPNPGKHVVIVGGTHGNESSGVSAIVRFHRALANGDVVLNSGKLSLLLGNPEAYQKNMRYIDKDLNRVFNAADDSTVEGRRALEITNFFTEYKDSYSLLDLHSVSIGDFKICVYKKENLQSLELAITISNISLHFAYHPEHMPGTLIEAARNHNVHGLMVECGNHISKQSAETALDHIHAFLVHHNLIDDPFLPEKTNSISITQYESIQAIKPGTNFRFLFDDITTGTRLKKGQTFAEDDDGYHIAPQACFIVVPSKIVKPTDTDAGFLGKKNLMETKELK